MPKVNYLTGQKFDRRNTHLASFLSWLVILSFCNVIIDCWGCSLRRLWYTYDCVQLHFVCSEGFLPFAFAMTALYAVSYHHYWRCHNDTCLHNKIKRNLIETYSQLLFNRWFSVDAVLELYFYAIYNISNTYINDGNYGKFRFEAGPIISIR